MLRVSPEGLQAEPNPGCGYKLHHVQRSADISRLTAPEKTVRVRNARQKPRRAATTPGWRAEPGAMMLSSGGERDSTVNVIRCMCQRLYFTAKIPVTSCTQSAG